MSDRVVKLEGLSAAEKRMLLAQLLQKRAERDREFALSHGQQALWFLQQMEPQSAAYNTPLAWYVRSVDPEVLRATFQAIVDRHPMLRTIYVAMGGQPRQVVRPEQVVDFQVQDAAGWGDTELTAAVIEAAHRPFDLATGPVFQVRLFSRADQDHILLIVAHHIVCDTWSLMVLLDELRALYPAIKAGRPLPPTEVKAEYADYVRWQQELLESAEGDRLWAYWRQELADLPGGLSMPTDHPRPAIQTYNGAAYDFFIPEDVVRELRALADAERTTLYSVLLAAFQVLVHRYSGCDDFAVASPILGRGDGRFDRTIGYFANLVALRADLRRRPNFRGFLNQVVNTVLGALAHDYPFPVLVERLQPDRDPGRAPLCDVAFALQKPHLTDLRRVMQQHASEESFYSLRGSAAQFDFGGLVLEYLQLPQPVARFDLELQLIESGRTVSGFLQYNTDLFDRPTIVDLAERFCHLLRSIVRDPDQSVATLELLAPQACSETVLPLSDRELPAATIPLHERIEAQAGALPATAVALRCNQASLSYRELLEQANRLARCLRSMATAGTGPVAVCLDRSIDLAVAVVGVLKSGRAYLVLDPDTPEELVRPLLQVAGVPIVLTVARLQGRLGADHRSVLALDAERELVDGFQSTPLETRVDQTDLASVVAGCGRSLPITHEYLCERVDWLQRICPLDPRQRTLHHSPLTHETVINELLWPLSQGAQVEVVEASDASATGSVYDRVVEADITALSLTPPQLERLRRQRGAADRRREGRLGRIVCSAPVEAGGWEVLPGDSLCRLDVIYAPPESATGVLVASGDLLQGLGTPAVQPPGSARVLILDADRHPVPVGVHGDVFLEAPCLAPPTTRDFDVPRRSGLVELNEAGRDLLVLRTDMRGRRRHDGMLELDESLARRCWVGGYRVDLADLETALVAHPSVADCAVMVRADRGGERRLVAYVVPIGPFDPPELAAQLRRQVLPAEMPTSFIPVTVIPRGTDGRADERSLAQVAVIDEGTCARWEDDLRAHTGCEKAVVLADLVLPVRRPLHISDLVGDQQATEAEPGLATVREGAGLPARERTGLPAVSRGGELEPPREAALPDLLRRAAAVDEHGITYVESDQTCVQSYRELQGEAERVLAGLRRAGLRPGDPVIFQLDRNRDFLTCLWGCVLGGLVPVPIAVPPSYAESSAARQKVQGAGQLLDRPLIITSERLRPGLEDLPMPRLGIETVEHLLTFAPDHDWHPSGPEDLALLMLTSGSTGVPKAVMLQHRNLVARSAGSVQMNGFTAQDVSLNWMPLDHVGGIIYFHLRDVFLGARQIHVPTAVILQDPLAWIDLLSEHRVTVTWAPNFAYAIVVDQAEQSGERRWDLSELRFILNGGEAVVPKTARRFLTLLMPYGLPATAMRPVYGMSETSSGITYSGGLRLDATSDDDAFVSVGRPIPGVSLRIVDEQGRVLEEGAIGRLEVSGTTVTGGYYRQPELNREIFAEDGWFGTGDRAYIERGELTIVGREKDVIIVNGFNYYCHELEAVVDAVEGVEVSFSAACAVRQREAQSDQLAIFFVPLSRNRSEGPALIRRIRTAIRERMELRADFVIALSREEIPKTEIGKIKRADLRRRFAEGEFDAALKELDVEEGNARTIPDWFHRTTWVRSLPEPSGTPVDYGLTAIFADRVGLGALLHDHLSRLSQPVALIERGTRFEQRGPRSFSIDPASPDDYERLLSKLAEQAPGLGRILYLWPYETSRDRADGTPVSLEAVCEPLGHLLSLVQALGRLGELNRRLSLFVVSSGVQAVSSADPLELEKASLPGLLKTIPHEIGWMKMRHVDLGETDLEVAVACLFQEMETGRRDVEVAYRGRQRWVARLRPCDLARPGRNMAPIVNGGTYVISGGLGGVGVELATHLMQHYRARLILLGRTVLPPREEWQLHRDAGGPLATSIENHLRLERAGDEFVYCAGDICDAQWLDACLTQEATRWPGPIEGIFHLAGEFHERLLLEESPAGLEAVLAAKVTGTQLFHDFLRRRGHGVLVAFSSVNGFFGGATVGAYSAASSFLDGFAAAQSDSPVPVFSIAWSRWGQVGMSRDSETAAASRSRGFTSLSVRPAMVSLLAVLAADERRVQIGVDGDNQFVRPLVQGAAQPLWGASAYVAPEGGQPPTHELQRLEVVDGFGTPYACPVVWLESLPVDAAGTIDRKALRTLVRTTTQSGPARMPPQSEVEKRVAAIWKQVLRVPEVNLHDNFFDLGGTSILSVKVHSLLEAEFKRQLPVVEVFKHPTLQAQAQALAQEHPSVPTFEESMSRGARRRQARETRGGRKARPHDPLERGPDA